MLYLLLSFIVLTKSEKDFDEENNIDDDKRCASKFVNGCLSLVYSHNKLTLFC